MSTKVSNTLSIKFRLANGLNLRGEEIETILTIYLKSNRLRQGIYQFDLTGGNYELFIGALQVNWGGAVNAIKKRAMAETADKDDRSQTRVIADQIRKLVERYLSANPKAIKHSGTKGLHIYVVSAIVAEAIYEIQTDSKRIFAKYLLDDDLERVTVDGGYFRLSDETEEAFQIRTLKLTVEKRGATIDRQAVEIRHLKSQLEDRNDLRLQLEASRAAEQTVRQNAEEDIGKFVDTNIRLRGQLAEARGECDVLKGKLAQAADQMRGLNRKATDFEGKAIQLGRRVEAAEEKMKELMQ
jgi:hypothetical protein